MPPHKMDFCGQILREKVAKPFRAGSGYHKLSGRRRRYRIIDQSRLLDCLRHSKDDVGFAEWHELTLVEKLAGAYHVREALWSECVAVGSREWIAGLASRIKGIQHEVICQEFPDELAESAPSDGLKVGRRAGHGLAVSLASQMP